MELDLVTEFNRATSMAVLDKKRIYNLIANLCFASVSLTDNEQTIVLIFITTKKGKPSQHMTYTISRELLTDTQVTAVLTAVAKAKV